METTLLAVVAILAGAGVQMTLGYGGGMLMVPVLLIIAGPDVAIPITLAMALAANLLVLNERPRPKIDWKTLAYALVPCLTVGFALGRYIAAGASDAAIQALAGTMVLLGVTIAVHGLLAADTPTEDDGEIQPEPEIEPQGPLSPTAVTASGAGIAAGLCTATIGFNSPPMLAAFAHLPADQRRVSLAAFFAPVSLLGLLYAFVLDKSVTPPASAWGLATLALLSILLAQPTGRRLQARYGHRKGLHVAILAVIALAGLACLLVGARSVGS